MTSDFDKFFDRVVNEFTTAKSKRRESRYWNDSTGIQGTARKIRPMTSNKTSSQQTKVDNTQQYVGDGMSPRKRNTSQKNHDAAAIAKGIGGRLRVQGINPKTPGAKVNSKQGRMEVKYTLPNGISKIGSVGKTEYKSTEKLFGEDD
jgi:hypothetical protein